MSTQTQLQIRGLARDPNAFQAASEGALRRAENVVVRSDGVAESRPNFDLAFEKLATPMRIKAMHEFDGSVITVEVDSTDPNYWNIGSNGTDITAPAGQQNLLQPPNYDDAETKFAEARGNLYVTGIEGPIVVESGSAGSARLAGVEVSAVTDWHGAEVSYLDFFVGYDPLHPENVPPIGEQVHSVGYRFVFARTDSSGYTRRSPPSHALLTTCIPGTNNWGFGTRFYFPVVGGAFLRELAAGDQVEFYRTRAVPSGSPRANVVSVSPRPEFFLAFAYTITSADIAAGYFVPPRDVVREEDLGAQLYTDSSQGSSLAAKYMPPSAETLAWWQRCMWFGRTVAKHRTPVVELQRLYRAGPMQNTRIFDTTLGSKVVNLGATIGQTTDGLVVGMLITDNYKYGPTVAGATFPASTRITKIVSATQFEVSANALASGAFFGGTMMDSPPQGLIAEKTGNGTYTIGSKIVTGLTSTAGWKAGMYWTDCVSGPGLDGTKVTHATKIESVDSANQIHMTKVARASGTVDAFVGDCLTVDALELYAWIEFYGGASDLTSHTRLSPWDGAYPYCFPIHDARYGDWGRQSAIAAICQWVNYYAGLFGVQAIPNGFLPTADYIIEGWVFSVTPTKDGDVIGGGGAGVPDTFSGLGSSPYPNAATGFSLEEVGVGGDAHTITSTTPSAFSPDLSAPTTSPTKNEIRPNRVYFSDVDEPESVPLTNYFDLGALDEPIQALVPLRDMLLVFKTDGIWRITGSAPSSWSVEPVDTTLRLVRPETVCVVNGIAYAWCDRGFFAVTEGGAQSLSANALDVELRAAAAFVMNQPLSHGAFVIGWHRRNLVLLGVPSGDEASACAKIYAYSLTTGAWSEWPMAWGPACESQALDAVYYSRPADSIVTYEARVASEGAPRGYDREFTIGGFELAADGVTVTISVSDAGSWEPVIGDFLGHLGGGVTTWRRITAIALLTGPIYSITIETAWDGVVEVDVLGVREAAPIVLEWHPTAPGGVPLGAMVREIHVQLDLRDADQKNDIATPHYLVGGTSERDTSPSTLVSSKARVPTIQPLRVGVSRQISRAANIAPYFKTSDISPIRVLGISLVHERTSERTTR